jgi:hypothetical protein
LSVASSPHNFAARRGENRLVAIAQFVCERLGLLAAGLELLEKRPQENYHDRMRRGGRRLWIPRLEAAI